MRFWRFEELPSGSYRGADKIVYDMQTILCYVKESTWRATLVFTPSVDVLKCNLEI